MVWAVCPSSGSSTGPEVTEVDPTAGTCSGPHNLHRTMKPTQFGISVSTFGRELRRNVVLEFRDCVRGNLRELPGEKTARRGPSQ